MEWRALRILGAVVAAVAIGLLHGRASPAAVFVPLGRPPVGEGTALPAALAPIAEALRKGDVDTALRLAREAVKTTPDSAPAQELLGAAARQAVTDAGSQAVDTKYVLAVIYHELGRPVEARGAFEEALRGKPFPSAAEARKLLDAGR